MRSGKRFKDDAAASFSACASSGRAIIAVAALGFPARRSSYEDRALFPRHSFAEMKRMHGQKPLWSPGAWQEYLCTAWLLARCPQVHSSRACAGETTAARPRVPITCFASCRFLLVTVPLPLSTLGIALPPHGSRSS